MKKILKSRIFLCLIVGICCLGVGVYGATKYQASEILYNGSDGTSMNVNEALNELYSNIKKCSTNEFCSKAKLGDYIKMTPTETTYTILSSLTGYSSNQTINPSELNIWRVIKKNEDGTIEMISEYVSSTKVYFKGQIGYLNFVGTLNLIAGQYGNSKYTIGSRIIGYNGQTETITNTSKFTYPAPWTVETSNNSNETLGGGDVMYEKDTNLVKEALGTLIATTPSGTVSDYWLGSRLYSYYSASNYFWRGRRVGENGNIKGIYYNMYIYDSSFGYIEHCSTIRPILTLKSGLTATGSGTSTDPWVLE